MGVICAAHYRPSAPAVRGLVSIPAGSGRTLLGAAYADASLRLWSVPKQACALHEPLKPDSSTAAALAPSRLRYAPPPADEPGRPGKLLVQFDAAETAAGGPPAVACSVTVLSVLMPVCQALHWASALFLAIEQARR